jgi:hypothetical protein
MTLEIKAPSRPYVPRGAMLDLMLCRDSEILLSGPAGTGKSRGVLEKGHLLCEKYPGCRGLILRKTRKSLTTTALVTFEDWVLPEGHPAKRGAKRDHRSVYYYPNGSVIDVGGLDNPDKIMSSEYDWVYVQEAIECLEEDIEKITTRLRNYVVPYQQLLMDTNPSSPSHWLKQRCERGATTYFETSHEDNPRLFNRDAGEWTDEGRDYIAKLDNLTGARKDRLRWGKWVAPEGARFPHAVRQIQGFKLTDLFPAGVPPHLVKWISIDYGLAAPYCGLWHFQDYDRNLYTYREDYAAGFTADVQAERIVAESPKNESYYAIYLDPAVWAQFPGHQGKTDKSAHDLYAEVFSKHPEQFGPLVPGFNKSRSMGFDTLDSILNRDNAFPNWFIEESCVNLWRELEDAVFYKNPRTAKFEEDLDPNCDDHALTCSVYGLHTHLHTQTPPEDPNAPIDILAAQKARREKEIQHASERAFRNRPRLRI